MLKISVLGSGSKGNAVVVENGDEALIIDMGFSAKELFKRLGLVNVPVEHLVGALLTHEHCDHSKGCRVFCNRCGLTLGATAITANFMRAKGILPERVLEFEPGNCFSMGSFEIKSFSLPHDAIDPVGFVIRCGNSKVGIATDLGSVGENVRQHLNGCDALILECNYDREMLMNSDRDINLKRRIAGPRGHLGNTETCNALSKLLSPKTRCLLLAHLSEECNNPDLVRMVCGEKIAELNRNDLFWEVLTQNKPVGNIVI